MHYKKAQTRTTMFPKDFCIACGESTYKNGECATCGYVGG